MDIAQNAIDELTILGAGGLKASKGKNFPLPQVSSKSSL
jgi:hypothetical protein